MKPTPIAEVLRRIRPLPPVRKASHLSGYIAMEKFRTGHTYSIHIRDMQDELARVINKQLCREIRQDKRGAA